MKNIKYYADLMDKYQTSSIKKNIEDILKINNTYSVIFDVGSNIGSFTKMISQNVKYDEIHLFEPVKEIYDYSVDNLKDIENVIINNKGISDKPEDKLLYKCPKNLNKKIRQVGILQSRGKILLEVRGCGGESNIGWNTMVDYDPGQTYTYSGANGFYKYMDKEIVSCITIDDYVEQKNIRSLDLIKIDVEGYCGPVLKGALKSIERFKPLLFVEICWGTKHPNWETNKLIYKNILDMGYKTVNCDNLLEQGFSGDLIFEYKQI